MHAEWFIVTMTAILLMAMLSTMWRLYTPLDLQAKCEIAEGNLAQLDLLNGIRLTAFGVMASGFYKEVYWGAVVGFAVFVFTCWCWGPCTLQQGKERETAYYVALAMVLPVRMWVNQWASGQGFPETLRWAGPIIALVWILFRSWIAKKLARGHAPTVLWPFQTLGSTAFWEKVYNTLDPKRIWQSGFLQVTLVPVSCAGVVYSPLYPCAAFLWIALTLWRSRDPKDNIANLGFWSVTFVLMIRLPISLAFGARSLSVELCVMIGFGLLSWAWGLWFFPSLITRLKQHVGEGGMGLAVA